MTSAGFEETPVKAIFLNETVCVAMSPEAIIPIHTEHPGEYPKHFGSKVRCLKDGERFDI